MILVDGLKTAQYGRAARAVLPFLLLVLAACQPAAPRERLFTGQTMGTAYHVRVVQTMEDAQAEALAGQIQAALDRVDALMSTYKPDSELSRFNAHESNEPFPISAQTAEVFDVALQVSAMTDGLFDVTVGPLINAYGFGPDMLDELPDDAEIEELLTRVGYHHLHLDREARTIQKARPDVYCDLGGVAKGYGTDEVVRMLDEQGLIDYMVEVGGEVRARGMNASGIAWRIGVEAPVAGERRVERVVSLSGQALTTSGDYRNFIEVDGRRLSHTIDPRTGRPVSHALASVSIIHESTTWADALATALMVMGPEAAHDFAIEHDFPVMLFIHDGEGGFSTRLTPRFEQFLAPSPS